MNSTNNNNRNRSSRAFRQVASNLWPLFSPEAECPPPPRRLSTVDNIRNYVDSRNNESFMNQRPPPPSYVSSMSAPATPRKEPTNQRGELLRMGLQGRICLGRQQHQGPAGLGYQKAGGYQQLSGSGARGGGQQSALGYRSDGGYQGTGGWYQSAVTGGFQGAVVAGTGEYEGAGGHQRIFPDLPPELDQSEFPSLTGGHLGQGDGHLQNLPTKPYGGKVNQSASQTSPFNMSSDDFPALPGPTPSPAGSAAFGASNEATAQTKDCFSKPGINNQTETEESPPNTGIVTSPDEKITNMPARMMKDQYGLAGLLSFLRVADSNPNLVSLAMGSDLTREGMSLNANVNLHPTFAGPLGQNPVPPEDINATVPPEYNITHYRSHGYEFVASIRKRLIPLKMTAYQDDLLFYMFYTYCQDVLQLLAAAELFRRDWRYHKEEQIWLTRARGFGGVEKGPNCERGIYYFFDPKSFRKILREFILEYNKLEGQPIVPYQYRQT